MGVLLLSMLPIARMYLVANGMRVPKSTSTAVQLLWSMEILSISPISQTTVCTRQPRAEHLFLLLQVRQLNNVFESKQSIELTFIFDTSNTVNPVQRFSDFAVHPDHPNLVVATIEDHTDPHPARVATYLALIDANTSTVTKLVTNADFFLCARFSPDGKFLSWQQWWVMRS